MGEWRHRFRDEKGGGKVSRKKFYAVCVFLLLLQVLAAGCAVLVPPARRPPARAGEEKKKEGKYILLGSYTTTYTTNDVARERNMLVTAACLNFRCIPPKTEFSFNRAVGAVTAAKGFVPAPVIEDDGSLKYELGGGMCQVSSTLYNAVLTAGLPVLERHPHSRPVSYVPPGRDATVYDDKDFRFLNDRGYPLLLRLWIGDGQLTVAIYGCRGM